MFCGDGINDLVALAAADVGMAIGSSDASAAATVTTKYNSVAGMLYITPLNQRLPDTLEHLLVLQVLAGWFSADYMCRGDRYMV